MDLIVPEVESVDTVLVINPDTRVINVGSGLLLGVETDNDAERVKFQCPKIVGDNLDLSQYHIYIHYQNAKGEKGKYLCEDIEDAGENITFSWLLSQKVTIFKGVTKFLVCAKKTDAETIVWNTTLASGNVLEGLAVDEDIVQQNDDVIEQILLKIEQIEVSGEFISRDEIYLGYAMSQDYPYSGHAGNYGIDVAKIVGSYKQDGTPTPDNPVEPEFNVINNFNTNGGNLFDASKLPTTSQGGATVTNNGDGSFTISGSGNLSEDFSLYYNYYNDDVTKLVKKGILTLLTKNKTYPYVSVSVKSSTGQIQMTNSFSNSESKDISTILDGDNIVMEIAFYGQSGKAIVSGTIKPMLYQDGDGTWHPFNVSNTPVSLELRALPDGTADIWEDGNTTTYVAKVMLNQNNNWSVYKAGVDGVTFFMISSSSSPFPTIGIPKNKLICNRLKPINPTNKYDISQLNTIRIGVFSKTVYVGVDSTQFPTLDDWKTYLQSNPISVWYALATPTTEPLAIPTLTSYYPFTNAWCDSELEPKLIEWHVNNKINYIEKLINEKQ